MKLLLAVVLMLFVSVSAYGINQDVQVDLLLAKITSSLKANRAADALPFFAQLEGMESSLTTPLPESFSFYYIDTLEKSGNKAKALSRADIYMDKYGKKGKHYGQVIEIMGRLQMQVEQEAKEAAARSAREAQETADKRARYAKDAAAAWARCDALHKKGDDLNFNYSENIKDFEDQRAFYHRVNELLDQAKACREAARNEYGPQY